MLVGEAEPEDAAVATSHHPLPGVGLERCADIDEHVGHLAGVLTLRGGRHLPIERARGQLRQPGVQGLSGPVLVGHELPIAPAETPPGEIRRTGHLHHILATNEGDEFGVQPASPTVRVVVRLALSVWFGPAVTGPGLLWPHLRHAGVPVMTGLIWPHPEGSSCC